MKIAIALLLAVCGVSGAWAQNAAPVGALADVKGLVTVSQGNTMANGVSGAAVFEGSRIATTSTGSAIVRLSNGCDIALKPSQVLAVTSGRDCKALIASVQSVGQPAVAGAGAGAGQVPGMVGAVTGITLGVSILDALSGS